MALLHSLPKRRLNAVFCDVDDTVAASTQAIAPPMAQVLGALIDAGFKVGFVSGASVALMTKQVSEQLPKSHLLLGTSGSHAVSVDAGGGQREIFKRGFSAAERAEILAALDSLIQHFHIKAETHLADQLQDRGCQFTLSALGRGADAAHKRAFDPDGSKRREWVRYLTDSLGDGRFEIRVGGTTSVDITAQGVDKATGLRQLLETLGWAAEDGIYFGDRFEETGNDHPVLQIMDCVAVSEPGQTLQHLQALLKG
jgi:HAD superfamily hydrolase (TIGR01484 family)